MFCCWPSEFSLFSADLWPVYVFALEMPPTNSAVYYDALFTNGFRILEWQKLHYRRVGEMVLQFNSVRLPCFHSCFCIYVLGRFQGRPPAAAHPTVISNRVLLAHKCRSHHLFLSLFRWHLFTLRSDVDVNGSTCNVCSFHSHSIDELLAKRLCA